MSYDDRLAQLPPRTSGIDKDSWTAPFWDATAAHRLVFARCVTCRKFRMPPTPFCPQCCGQAIEWVEPPGDPLLYTYTIVERATAPGVTGTFPYVPAVVEFPEADNARLITNIVDSPLSAIVIGARVILGWHDVDDAMSLAIFSMADEKPTNLSIDGDGR